MRLTLCSFLFTLFYDNLIKKPPKRKHDTNNREKRAKGRQIIFLYSASSENNSYQKSLLEHTRDSAGNDRSIMSIDTFDA